MALRLDFCPLLPDDSGDVALLFAGKPGLREHRIVRKQVRYNPEQPFYVVMVEAGYFTPKGRIKPRVVVDVLPPVDRLVFSRSSRRVLGRRVAKVEGSRVWSV